jgi:hypothetical protein
METDAPELVSDGKPLIPIVRPDPENSAAFVSSQRITYSPPWINSSGSAF